MKEEEKKQKVKRGIAKKKKKKNFRFEIMRRTIDSYPTYRQVGFDTRSNFLRWLLPPPAGIEIHMRSSQKVLESPFLGR